MSPEEYLNSPFPTCSTCGVPKKDAVERAGFSGKVCEDCYQQSGKARKHAQ